MFKRFWWIFLVMIPTGLIAGLVVAAVVTYVMPKKYESEAVIEVKPISGQPGSPVTPEFFGTEFEKIKSSIALGKVVDSLELINKWGVDKETAIRILKGAVTTENIRGTDLISIRVRHTNKEDTRDVTAQVAKAYRDHRIEILKRGEGQGLLELKKAVRDLEDKVDERRKVLESSSRPRGIVDKVTDPAGVDTAKKASADEATVDYTDYAEEKRQHEADQALLQSLKLKQINEEISAKVQDESIVIHEEPQIAQAPVSPNVPLNLAVGTGLGLLLSPLLSLPLIWLLNRLKPVGVSA